MTRHVTLRTYYMNTNQQVKPSYWCYWNQVTPTSIKYLCHPLLILSCHVFIVNSRSLFHHKLWQRAGRSVAIRLEEKGVRVTIRADTLLEPLYVRRHVYLMQPRTDNVVGSPLEGFTKIDDHLLWGIRIAHHSKNEDIRPLYGLLAPKTPAPSWKSSVMMPNAACGQVRFHVAFSASPGWLWGNGSAGYRSPLMYTPPLEGARRKHEAYLHNLETDLLKPWVILLHQWLEVW